MLAKLSHWIRIFIRYWNSFRASSILAILCAQCFVHFFIIKPLVEDGPLLSVPEFAAFSMSTFFIAMAGYLLSDYYDIKVNPAVRTKKYYATKLKNISSLYTVGFILNVIGCLLGIWVAWKVGFFNMGLLFIVFSTVLYFYSLRYKRLFFWGPFVISFTLSFFSIVNVWLFDFFALRANPIVFGDLYASSVLKTITFIVLGYAIATFFLIFVKETVKEMTKKKDEDALHYNTFIPEYNSKRVKSIISIIILTLIVLLAFAEILFYSPKTLYFLLTVIILGQVPLLIFLFLLQKAHTKEDFSLLLNIMDFIIFIGIISILGISVVL